jgi:thioredoxin-like negative regulator of GroEL
MSAPPEEDRSFAVPSLVFFYGRTSGLSRRVEGYLAQILQRRHNHSTFRLLRVPVDDNRELAEAFRVRKIPTIVVVHGRRVRARIEAPSNRLTIEEGLGPWLA